jgi:hypothetical protein
LAALVLNKDGGAAKLDHLNFFGGRAMSAKMLFTKTIHAPKALATLAVSLVFFLAALPAHAQDQYRILWIGHPVMIIVGLILVLLAGIGAAAIFCG